MNAFKEFLPSAYLHNHVYGIGFLSADYTIGFLLVLIEMV